jgi:hypothetical protein
MSIRTKYPSRGKELQGKLWSAFVRLNLHLPGLFYLPAKRFISNFVG